ncbi:MAG: ATP-binding protein [Candidatus Aminicenantes bacterium]|jgi:predicted AAA+ superfamily ATPase
MIQEDLLKRVIVEQQSFLDSGEDLWQREYQPDIVSSFNNDHIILLTGVRRAGKSYLLKIVKKIAFKEKKLEDKNFLYINFEDERLVNIEAHELSLIIELYFRLYQPDVNKKIFLLFDEIQHIPHWDRWINRLFEQKKYKIFITGSNASLLKEETGQLLSGRTISIEIFPLSFKEYLYYFKKEAEVTEKDFYDLQKRTVLLNGFDDYIQKGGFPDFLKTGNSLILQEYFRDIIQRDIIYRYSIRYKKEIKEMAKIIISGPGNIISLKKIASAVGMRNINTVKNYLGYLQDSYLVLGIPIFSPSVKKQVYNPDKYYGIDAGLYHAVSFTVSESKGPLYENTVFLELKRRLKGNAQLFYYKTKTGKEIDFLFKDRNNIQLIQVSADISDKNTLHREKRALIEAAKEIGIKEGMIINGNIKDSTVEDGTRISIVPIWEFLILNP